MAQTYLPGEDRSPIRRAWWASLVTVPAEQECRRTRMVLVAPLLQCLSRGLW